MSIKRKDMIWADLGVLNAEYSRVLKKYIETENYSQKNHIHWSNRLSYIYNVLLFRRELLWQKKRLSIGVKCQESSQRAKIGHELLGTTREKSIGKQLKNLEKSSNIGTSILANNEN